MGAIMENLDTVIADAQTWLTTAVTSGSNFFGPEILRELIAASVVFLLGWFLARGKNKRAQKERMVDELIVAQRELIERAYPEQWGEKDRRDVWMLNPYLERLKFVFANIKDQKVLRRAQEDLIEEYFFSVEKFLIQWSQTKRRGHSYNTRFQDTFEKLHDVVVAVSKAHLERLSRLSADLGERTACFDSMPDQFRTDDVEVLSAAQ